VLTYACPRKGGHVVGVGYGACWASAFGVVRASGAHAARALLLEPRDAHAPSRDDKPATVEVLSTRLLRAGTAPVPSSRQAVRADGRRRGTKRVDRSYFLNRAHA
jgi:hypothetical protein